jgi:23S rRNA (adenine2503-C2)-methyltransferase
MKSAPPFILDCDFSELSEILQTWGEPEYRAGQVWQGLYRSLWSSADQFTNVPKALRQRLSDEFRFTALHPATELVSSDRETRKILFHLSSSAQGGDKAVSGIEAVLMRYDQRRSLCISTQAGCGMGCVFCATGQMGFMRHLTSGEIVEQVLYFARQLASAGEQLSHVVVMGMGEPFHNYEATMAAIDRLNHPIGFHFGARRFTISTVGLVPSIRRFANERRQVNLAISLHAANDELRSAMLPVNRKYPLADLLEACRNYVETTHRRLTFEWALIHSVNDSPAQAGELVQLLRTHHVIGMCHVNIIPLNPTQGYVGRGTSRERAAAFQDVLVNAGVPCTIRVRRGLDIQAGCGQLATEKASHREVKPPVIR